MRDFKFRAWDSDFKVMVDPSNFNHLLDGLVVGYSRKNVVAYKTAFSSSVDLNYKKVKGNPFTQGFIVMQDTDLTDDNDTNIYEGDIVRAKAKVEFDDDSIISDVIYGSSGQWEIRERKDGCIYRHGLPVTWGGWFKLEVIGNIYENPELLTN